MAAVAAMAVAAVEKTMEKEKEKTVKPLDEVESFMKVVTAWLKKNKQALFPFQHKGSYIDFGRQMKMPFRKTCEPKGEPKGEPKDEPKMVMVMVMQRTVCDIRLSPKLQRKGILRRIIEFLLSAEGGCEAVQLEAVQNPSLHVALKRSAEKPISIGVWHDQYLSCEWFTDPQIGHSFVRFN